MNLIRKAIAILFIPAFAGCVSEPETPEPQTPKSCPLRELRKLGQELDQSINSVLKLIETYEILAYMFNRTDLLITTGSARKKVQTMRLKLLQGEPLDQKLLEGAVQDLQRFERQLLSGEMSL